jgi:S1-C subfamily serine protease
MANFGKLDKDLFCKTLHVRGDLVIDCYGNFQNIGNISIINDASVGGNLTVQGNANIQNGFITTKLIDKTGSALYSSMKNASVTIYDSTNQEFSSGFFVSESGWIVSSAHGFLDGNVVTKHNANSLYVSITNMNGFADNNMVVQADSLYIDAAGDLAVIKVPGVMSQSYLEWGDITNASPGDRCFVIGNPLASDQQSISDGIVRDREFVKFPNPLESILTSVSSYSGHSGSPIVNERGKVLGVLTFGIQNSANADVSTLTGGPSQRIAEPIVNAMISNNSDYTTKGFLGANVWFPVNTFDIVDLGLVDSGFSTKGIRLGNIFPGEPLEVAGLQNDDIIIQVDTEVVGDLDSQTHPSTVTWFKTPGEAVTVQYIRPPSTVVFSNVITLATFPFGADEPLFGKFSGQGGNAFFNLPGTKVVR